MMALLHRQPEQNGDLANRTAISGTSRRRLLGWAAGGGAALVGSMVGGLQRAGQVRAQAAPSIVGSWVITFPQGSGPGSDPNEHQVVSFTSDGILIATNSPSSPPSPDQGPPTRTYSTAGQGAWASNGPGQVRLSFVSIDTDEQGMFVDLVRINALLSLTADGISFTGSFGFEVRDAGDNVIFSEPATFGTVNGTRITA